MVRLNWLLVLALWAAPAVADEASWPIIPTLAYPAAVAGSAGIARADVLVGVNAKQVEIEVWGLDGMRAGGDRNLVRVTRPEAVAGTQIEFDVPFNPGPGRSSLVVSAKAESSGLGPGVTVLAFPYGTESASQRAEHSACVRRDPDGVWIRLDDCSQIAAAGPPEFTVAELRASPPVGARIIVTGFVVDAYLCPPCPKGAMCKPCAGPSAVYVADAPGHAPIDFLRPPADVAVFSAADPAAYPIGSRVRLEVEAADREKTGFDGIVVAGH